jgi:hypothetical protein
VRHPPGPTLRLLALAAALVAGTGSASAEADRPSCRGAVSGRSGGPVECTVAVRPVAGGGLSLTFEFTRLPDGLVAAEPGRIELPGPVRPGGLALEQLASASFVLLAGDRFFRAGGAPAPWGDVSIFLLPSQVDGPEVQEALHATVHVSLAPARLLGPLGIAPGVGDQLELTLEF